MSSLHKIICCPIISSFFLTICLVSAMMCKDYIHWFHQTEFVRYSDSSYPYPLYISSRNFSVPLPNPIPNPIISASRRTIHSQIRNITFPRKASSPWPRYRLGDMFKSWIFRSRGDGWDLHRRQFANSIAVEYMKRINDPFNGSAGDGDYDTMTQIVNERIDRDKTLQSKLPDNCTLVIHLRTGDVIDKNDIPIREFLSFNNAGNPANNGRSYTRGLPFYAEIWDQVQNEHIQIERIMVITGWHLKMYHFRSIAYINEVIKYLEQMVDRVDIRVNENPDEDFLIMTSSKWFVKSGGGFSRMIGIIVERQGGRVFG